MASELDEVVSALTEQFALRECNRVPTHLEMETMKSAVMKFAAATYMGVHHESLIRQLIEVARKAIQF